jgi:hypothetical protein
MNTNPRKQSSDGMGLTEDICQATRITVFVAASLLGPIPPWLDRRKTEEEALHEVALKFLSRSIIQLTSISTLVRLDLVSDATALHRSMIERFLLFEELAYRAEFKLFAERCFLDLCKQDQRILSDPNIRDKSNVTARKFTPSRRRLYEEVDKDEAVRSWKRPRPEDVARRLDLKFLYDGGFDYASTHVHPNPFDGSSDYFRLVYPQREPTPSSLSATTLRNSQLACLLLNQTVMNVLPIRWRSFYFDLFSSLLDHLGASPAEYKDKLAKIIVMVKEGASIGERHSSVPPAKSCIEKPSGPSTEV